MTSTKTTQDYIRDGAAIYARSFAIIRAEADLAGLSREEERVAVRIVHACGDSTGAEVMRASAVGRSTRAASAHFKVSGRSTSRPVAPGLASPKGRSLSSAPTGVWSEQMLAQPAAVASDSACRSLWVRKGGQKRACGLK